MHKNTYLKNLIESCGHLNKNKLKTEEKQPDFQGFIKIENKIYKLAAWEKIKDDKLFYSLKATKI
jgi:hypothetical protein